MNGATRLLHDPTSSASPPPAHPTRGAFQQLPLKPRGALQASINFPNASNVADRLAPIDGSASALCSIEKANGLQG